MADDPGFASIVNIGSGIPPATAVTSTTAPSSSTTVFTAGASGSKVEEIRVMQILTTGSGGIINLFHKTGSTYTLIDQFLYGAGTVSTTSAIVPIDYVYNNLVLASGYTLEITNTVASGTGSSGATHAVTVFGGNF